MKDMLCWRHWNKFWFSFIGKEMYVRNLLFAADDDAIRPSLHTYIHIVFSSMKTKSQKLKYRIHISIHSWANHLYGFYEWWGSYEAEAESENPDLESREQEKWMTVGKVVALVVVGYIPFCYVQFCSEESELNPTPFDLLVALHMRFNSPFPIPFWSLPYVQEVCILITVCVTVTQFLYYPNTLFFVLLARGMGRVGQSGSGTETKTGLRVIHSPVFIHKIGFFEWKSLLHFHFRSKNRIFLLETWASERVCERGEKFAAAWTSAKCI